MRKLLIISIVLIQHINCFSQEDPVLSQYMFNNLSFNPGYAGSKDMMCIHALTRNEWLGFPGAPLTMQFSANTPFNLFNREHGAGIFVRQLKKGYETNISFQVDYALRWKMKIGDGKLGTGISLGLNDMKLNSPSFTGAVWPGSSGGSSDPLIFSSIANKTIFDFGLGAYYKTEKLYLGISATHLATGNYSFNRADNGGEVTSYYITPHYYITGGYKYTMSNPLYELEPSFILISDGVINTIQLNTNLVYNNRVWGGISYRAGSAFVGIFGIELMTGVRVYYSYDYETTDIGKFSRGSHEFSVLYCFKLKKEKIPQRYKSIRFL